MLVDITGENPSLIPHECRHMGCLPSWGAAGINDELPRLRGKDMGDQHGAFILYLAVSLLQGLQCIQGTMGSAEDSFRRPSGGNDLNPLCLQAFQQCIPAGPQGIRPQGKNRLPIIEGTKCLCFLIAEFLDPASRHPQGMTIFQ